ncbi:MAG: alpha/beta hydrolase [Gammaproteobacteria bacterium HGW-Gammaproteobacteria-6]|nr:MAG: alpha/beta hydrolase [Gammaproteobacteria bacterium HGW-Gammaproteobacteria-6]
MHAHNALISSQGLFKVHTTFYPSPAPQGTIILVNGSLATSASFSQTLRYLQPHFNVVLFDEPYAGQSRIHNPYLPMLNKEHEAGILLDLIKHFNADHLLSFSWGGASTLLALAQNPAGIRRAIIMAFSPVISPAMRDYLSTGRTHLLACNRSAIAELVNATLGQHLPSLYKRFNFRHVCSLAEHEYLQMAHHIEQILEQESHCYMKDAELITTPLLFINGDLDDYTCADDARQFGRLIDDCEFARISQAGHFLDAEGKTNWEQTRAVVLSFLLPRRNNGLLAPSAGQSLGSS